MRRTECEGVGRVQGHAVSYSLVVCECESLLSLNQFAANPHSSSLICVILQFILV